MRVNGLAPAEFHPFRSDIEGNYMRTIALAPQLADILSHAHREERSMGTADLRLDGHPL